jgi:RNA polymerase sigma-70 factor (TIGR02960 family)
MSTDVLERAQAGDQGAFRELVEPHRRELQVHCYRMLGSIQDAEDMLQETMLAAWQGLDRYEQRASLRTWLYRIATNRCLNALRSASRRPRVEPAGFEVEPPEPTRLGEIVWLEPYPDVLLEGVFDREPGPEARYEIRESMSLAFVTALQRLPPRQRVVLVLRDALGFGASEVAAMLDITEQSVTSALKRARATLQREADRPGAPPPVRNSATEREVVGALARAFESGDVDGIVSLLTEDAWLRMPPLPLEYQGKAKAEQFFSTVAFRPGRQFRLVETGANGQPALGVYLRDRSSQTARALGLLVLTLAGDRVSAITRFDNAVLPYFGLPRSLPD